MEWTKSLAIMSRGLNQNPLYVILYAKLCKTSEAVYSDPTKLIRTISYTDSAYG